jgi:hypothetical protein
MFVEDYLVERLHQIVEATGAEIVLSSTWRIDWHPEDISQNGLCFEDLCEKLAAYNMAIVDRTGEFRHTRGQEIHEWFEEHPGEVASFVILDDMYDMGDLTPFLVQTDAATGLTEEDVRAAIDILNK